MFEKELISIIIPVYNVEKYLIRCLESVEKQDYKNTEVILVDDGSSDESARLCDEYCVAHSNARVIHQKNMGLSGARNSGVDDSRGSFITFVDSDDIIAENYISSLVSAIKSTQADMAVGRTLQFWDEKDIKTPKKGNVHILTTEEALIQMCNGYQFGVSACCKLYKKELITRYPYPLGKLYEDLDTTYKIVGDCRSIAFYDEYIYYYRQRNNSISHNNGLSSAQLYGLEAADNQYHYICRNYPKASVAAQARCILKAFDYIEMISGGSDDEKECFKRIREYSIDHSRGLLTNRMVNIPNKCRFLSLYFGYYPSVLSNKVLYALKKNRVKRNGRK